MICTTIDGRLGKDAEVLKTSNGKEYIRFSLASDYYFRGNNGTKWIDVTSFDENVVKSQRSLLKKGRFIIANGILNSEARSRNGQVYENLFLNASNITFPNFSSGKGSNEKEAQPEVAIEAVNSNYTATTSDMPEVSEDLPF